MTRSDLHAPAAGQPAEGAPGQRAWRRGERSKLSILQVFRTAYEDRDARHAAATAPGQDPQITPRSKQRREGVSETQLRAHLEADLNALLNTIRLDAAEPLDDAPHVARSILNYGFRDLSSVAASELNTPGVINSIRQSLIDHEPRLVAESIEVRITERQDAKDQRLSLTISADLMGDPVDIPLDFDAEVDLGAGKLRMSKLRVQT